MATSLGSSPNPAKGRYLAIVTGQKGPSHVLGGLSWWQSTPFRRLLGDDGSDGVAELLLVEEKMRWGK
ncbi:hypothetical protein TorRG33x02_351020 [Trema orientale]|uniref:Uncharacterized protein n=1 Tax=Trema orientale TaxID=63057 RepID=A0A2P5AGH8_TREOI|nr:hypothetical protein TorRG33x02_351020 [Trema orientale]